MAAVALKARRLPAGSQDRVANTLFAVFPREHQEKRVRELLAARFSESLIHTLTGWSITDIRAAAAATLNGESAP